jgi:AcrR family transcriptional regulator
MPKRMSPEVSGLETDPLGIAAGRSRSTGAPPVKARSAVATLDPNANSSSAAYHHGDLRRALLDAAVTSIAEAGPAALSLRALATTVGVSHAAPVHHFGDKAGLFTAIAIEGFELLTADLIAVWTETEDFMEVGVGYIRFALKHKGHFEVMFRPELTDIDNPGLLRAKNLSFGMLHDPLATLGPVRDDKGSHVAALASWSIVHGLATLALSGNLSEIDLAEPDDLARHVLMHLRVL